MDIENTAISVVFLDKEGDPICRMSKTGRLPEPFDTEIRTELGRTGRIVNAVIEIRSTNDDIAVVHLDRDKTVVDTKEREEKDGSSLWARKCPVTLVDFGNSRVATTKYPENNLRIVEMTNDLRLRVHVISVSAQNGQMFFNHQVIIDQPCYQRDGHIVYAANPDITDKWHLDDALDEMFEDKIASLPHANSMIENVAAPTPDIENHGNVLWYSVAMGLGAIRTAMGDAKVHWTQLPERESGFRYLAAGERVHFERLVPASKSAYTLEAKSIQLIA